MDQLQRTVRLGPLRVGLRLPVNTSGLQRPWCLPEPGERLDLELEVTTTEFAAGDALEFDEFDAHHCSWRIGSVRGQWDHREGTGTLTLSQPIDLVGGLREFGSNLLWMLQALVLQAGGLLVHGAALSLSSGVFVVCGVSGAGKSTLASRFVDRALHDDLVYLVPSAPDPSKWQAWRQNAIRIRGEHLPWATPLAAMVRLAADRSRTHVDRANWPQCVGEIAPHCWYAGGAAAAATAERIAALTASVPIGVLTHCLSDPVEVVEVALASLLLPDLQQVPQLPCGGLAAVQP